MCEAWHTWTHVRSDSESAAAGMAKKYTAGALPEVRQSDCFSSKHRAREIDKVHKIYR